ncbi:MAG: transposase [Oscillospiraceae bacterium]|jgi:REP element-mobilizing transposase RayT|nr:transposase [Oscillospiraceae bacterium]
MAGSQQPDGVFFVTICTKGHEGILGSIENDEMVLSEAGMAVQDCIETINKVYPSVLVDSSCIMPNHIHLLLICLAYPNNVPLHQLIQQFKSSASKKARRSLWESYRLPEKIIVNHTVVNARQYIRDNAWRWVSDCYHPDSLQATLAAEERKSRKASHARYTDAPEDVPPPEEEP